MIGDVEFSEGLTRIGIAVRQPADAKTQSVYFDALEYQTTAEEWGRFTKLVSATGRFSWFPKMSELLEALREFRGQPHMLGEANAAYERVLGAGTYAPEGGTHWSFRSVRDSCGVAAAEAFLAAGGHHAFATTWDESKRREAFIAAYKGIVTIQPDTALLPPGEQPKQITSGSEPTAQDATAIVAKLESTQPKITKAPVIVEATEERLAALRRQAQEIQQ